VALRRRHVTIADVARKAGVSLTTVSHVLSSRRHVAPATREKVLAVVAELDYRPNELARSMVTQRTSTIALIVPDITNPFYPAMARGLQDVLAPAGYYGLVVNTDGDAEVERATLDQMITRRVDGIGFAGYYRHLDQMRPAVDAGIPVVLLGGSTPQAGVDTVTTDDLGGARQATRYLLEKGHRRIGIITGPSGGGPAAERVAGYRLALSAEQLPAEDELLVRVPFSREGGARGMARLLDLRPRPDAVVCTNDIVAIGALDTARERGFDVPGDIAVVGYDDIDAAALVSPRLTTMVNPAREQGRACARLLLHRLNDEEQQPPQRVTFTSTLVVRESA
jgi:LacI family transcriptional regulator